MFTNISHVRVTTKNMVLTNTLYFFSGVPVSHGTEDTTERVGGNDETLNTGCRPPLYQKKKGENMGPF